MSAEDAMARSTGDRRSVMNHCGLNHSEAYRNNTDRWPNSNKLASINDACAYWHEAIERGLPHEETQRRWHLHSIALGALHEGAVR